MPKEIFRETTIKLIDGTPIRVYPLKLVYLKQLMKEFDRIKESKTDDETLLIILDCIAIAMKQLYPALDTGEKVADNIDMNALYVILDYAANIDIDPNKKKSIAEQGVEELKTKKKEQENEGWETFDLSKYEAQAFLLGIWKNFDELEASISLPELTEILSTRNEQEYLERKFFAAIQGIDIDGGSKKEEEDPWEAMKARVAQKTSGIPIASSNDITSYQGVKAKQNGFGIGMGLDYEKVD
jgi:hypothetical protein